MALMKKRRSSPISDEKNEKVDETSWVRVFSDEDEVALLHAVIQFRLDNNNKEPNADWKSFLELVNNFIHADVSVKQLRDKIRHLKDKYFAKLRKGKAVVFLNLHQEELFKLSEKVWGGQNKDKNVEKANDVENAGEEMYPFLTQLWDSDASIPKLRNFRLDANKKMMALEKECKEVFLKELHLYRNKLDLKKKLAKVVLEDQMLSSDT